MRPVGRKVSLPLTQAFSDAVSTPTVDAMRARLGGRVPPPTAHTPRLGGVVQVSTGAGSHRLGVLLSADAATADVYLERGLVKRTSAASITTSEGAVPAELDAVARQVRLFAGMAEGQDVHVEQPDGTTRPAVLREKCRYGALVETPEGTILGVGFGKLWPRPSGRGGSSDGGRAASGS